MIRDKLLPEIKKEFAGWEIEFCLDSNLIARFPSVQEEVGDVVVYDDGDEVTVLIENISHGHFNNYDGDIKESQREEMISKDVIDFLKALFSDRILLHVSTGKKSGGWVCLDLQDGPAQLSSRYNYYLWSKPYQSKAK